jgi:hypothetical protein
MRKSLPADTAVRVWGKKKKTKKAENTCNSITRANELRRRFSKEEI